MIPFNKPFLCGKEIDYIKKAVENGKISGDGMFSRKCQDFFRSRYHFSNNLLTTSCTDALEMAAILCRLQPGDEVIAPSFTFVSTVNPFVMNGANIIFCDVREDYPCIDEYEIEELITKRTRVIVVTHYAGIACNMDVIMDIARRNNLIVIEDAAHAIDAKYKDQPLGGIGQFGTFSFHETKNIISGEGGMIVVNGGNDVERAEIIREKGTNRAKFFRGEIDKYNWVDIGSSFLPSEITAAFLFAQLENIDIIQEKRKFLWDIYYKSLLSLQKTGRIGLPVIPWFADHNAHLFYIIAGSIEERTRLIDYLKIKGMMAIFHYQPLHDSPFWKDKYVGAPLHQTEKFADCLLRLPLFYELTEMQVNFIVQSIMEFYAVG